MILHYSRFRNWVFNVLTLTTITQILSQLVARFKKCRRVVLQCDIHGHSRKEGLFVYGCVPDASWRRYIQDRERKKVEKEMLEAQMEKRREKER